MASKAFLVDLMTGERLEFQFAPSDLKGDRSSGWTAAKVPGLSHPRYQFTAGEDRNLQFTLEFFRLPDIEERVRWLQSLTYPGYKDGMLSAPPHLVELVFGTLYEGVAWMVISAKERYFDLFTTDLTPLRAEVEITLKEYVEQGRDAREIRK